MVTDTATVLVLTPRLGGRDVGELLAGLTREVAGADGRLVVVETLPESPLDATDPPAVFDTRVAWSHADGVVCVGEAVDRAYLQQLRDSGRVVVVATAPVAGFDAPAAMPDNHGGTFTAVEHLVGHGHTRIGFVGDLTVPDVRDRYAAYVSALETYDLPVDPAIVLGAADGAEAGGGRAARDLLASPRPPTALMVASDRTALGLVRALTDAGADLPDDLAIVAFDNIDAGAFSAPSLSSVNQRLDEVGALAGRLVLAGMRGEAVPNGVFTSQPGVLMVRTSCGCTAGGTLGRVATTGPSLDVSPELLRDELQDVLVTALLTGDDIADGPARDAVLAAVAEAERLLLSGEQVTDAGIRSLLVTLGRLTSRPETQRRIVDAVADYAERVAVPAGCGGGAPAAASDRVTAALWKAQAGAFLREAEAAESAVVEQYAVDAGLLDTGSADPRELRWLAGTHLTVGSLALWEGDPGAGLLRIVGMYDPSGAVPDQVGALVGVEAFPPEPLIAAVDAATRQVCVVVPVRTATSDWGLLAVVGSVDVTSPRETYQHWAALLCAALESQRLQQEVRRSALYDQLTGLPNRRLFLERLTAEIARQARSGAPFAVLFLDLDGFKLINDSLGHQMGDQVLAAVGDRIAHELREVDTGARFGGDEFAILLPDTDPAGALLVARRVQAALARSFALDGPDVSLRSSIGIATSWVEYGSAEDILRDADTAMYRAKLDDPGTIAFFDDAMRAHVVQKQLLHLEVRRALEEHQFEVFYQPIVNLTSGRTDRFEALVRWRHPERGLVLPDEFLPVLEDTGLIVSLGHWILDEVCRQLAEWGPRVVNVSVNVSDREFWHQDLLPHVLEVLRRHRLTPDRLTLEITEGVLMRHPAIALRKMHELHDAGLRLHIDDFGTGYSSLETLHRFPVDAFKIDRSFLRSLASGDHTVELMTSLVGLGTSLGLAVVAEGVETGEQLEFLKSIGCATGQGYLFMPAVSKDRASDLLDRNLADGAVGEREVVAEHGVLGER